MVDYMQMRKALRRERIAAGLTLDALAQRSGLNRATIHSIENVKREPTLRPELNTVDRLVNALGLTLASFFARLETSSALLNADAESRTEGGSGQRLWQARGGEHRLVAAVRQVAGKLHRGIDRFLEERERTLEEDDKTAGRPRT
jgi:transcriptional regulator with XRE-family HTH domain